MKRFWLLTTALLSVCVLSSCKKDECKDVICAPCPGIRMGIKMTNTLGFVDTNYAKVAMVYAFRDSVSTTDTLYETTFQDSCITSLLIDMGRTFHIVSGAHRDTLVIRKYDFQPAIAVTECCNCYAPQTVKYKYNKTATEFSWPANRYDSDPVSFKFN